MERYTLIGEIVNLMHQSPVHSGCTVSDLGRLIAPPIALGTYAIMRDQSGMLSGFASFATFNEHAERAFLTGSRLIQPADWNSGNRLWLIDVLAPQGDAHVMLTALRDYAKSNGFSEVRFKRTKSHVQPRFSRVAI
jgi:cytolysin-activating lysine-acyltransferase